MKRVDHLSDMLVRIRNAISRKRYFVDVPSTRTTRAVSKLLTEVGYLQCYVQPPTSGVRKIIVLVINYDGTTPLITRLKRISKPGRRIYAGAKNMPNVLGGYGTVVVSTVLGLMTSQQARKMNIGGELLFSVW